MGSRPAFSRPRSRPRPDLVEARAKAMASDHRRQAKSNGNIFSMPRTNHSGYFGYHNNYAEIKSLSVLRVMSGALPSANCATQEGYAQCAVM